MMSNVFITARFISKPAKNADIQLRDILGKLNREEGDLTQRITVKSNDEIGELTKTFSSVSDNLREIITDIRYQLSEMRNGNYCIKSNCADKYQGDYIDILEALTDIREGLNDTIQQIDNLLFPVFRT